jgi:uncharacterized protein YndB with AHSA1/START domain
VVKFSIETVLEKSIDVVWRAFDNPANLKLWMPTLTDFQPLSGVPGQPGAVTRLTIVENGRTVIMDETVIARREPSEFDGRYDSEYGSNEVRNRFESQAGGQTKWTITAEFAFKGFFRYLAPVFKGVIRKHLTEDCNRFKEKLESGALAT